jgi:phospholipid/cholesterol/gamma-HCH transport system ATP-binding protein
MTDPRPIIEIKNLGNKFDNRWVHKNLDLTINQGEIVAIIGGSGSGKTTLLRNILMLLKPSTGSIKVFDTDISHCTEAQAAKIRRRWGVAFQQNALFSSLTLLENVMFQIKTFSELEKDLCRKIGLLKIAFSGLPIESANRYPAELSGGMQKRAAVARAIALDPELLFLDEPTAGLDPQAAGSLDQLMLDLRKTLGLTVVIVTHDIDTLWTITDRVVFLGEGKILAAKPIRELVKDPHPEIQEYFSGVRGQRES